MGRGQSTTENSEETVAKEDFPLTRCGNAAIPPPPRNHHRV
jgi:hypothetical protein